MSARIIGPKRLEDVPIKNICITEGEISQGGTREGVTSFTIETKSCSCPIREYALPSPNVYFKDMNDPHSQWCVLVAENERSYQCENFVTFEGGFIICAALKDEK